MVNRDTMRSGGRRLRHIREARQMTQQDVERATAARYGYEGRVYAQQLSRLEKGAVDKPPILDLLRVGEVLGLNPDDIAEMFGLWPRRGDEPPLEPRVDEVVSLYRHLPDDLKEGFLTQLEVVVALTRARLRERLADRERAESGEREERGERGAEAESGAEPETTAEEREQEQAGQEHAKAPDDKPPKRRGVRRRRGQNGQNGGGDNDPPGDTSSRSAGRRGGSVATRSALSARLVAEAEEAV